MSVPVPSKVPQEEVNGKKYGDRCYWYVDGFMTEDDGRCMAGGVGDDDHDVVWWEMRDSTTPPLTIVDRQNNVQKLSYCLSNPESESRGAKAKGSVLLQSSLGNGGRQSSKEDQLPTA